MQEIEPRLLELVVEARQAKGELAKASYTLSSQIVDAQTTIESVAGILESEANHPLISTLASARSRLDSIALLVAQEITGHDTLAQIRQRTEDLQFILELYAIGSKLPAEGLPIGEEDEEKKVALEAERGRLLKAVKIEEIRVSVNGTRSKSLHLATMQLWKRLYQDLGRPFGDNLEDCLNSGEANSIANANRSKQSGTDLIRSMRDSCVGFNWNIHIESVPDPQNHRLIHYRIREGAREEAVPRRTLRRVSKLDVEGGTNGQEDNQGGKKNNRSGPAVSARDPRVYS